MHVSICQYTIQKPVTSRLSQAAASWELHAGLDGPDKGSRFLNSRYPGCISGKLSQKWRSRDVKQFFELGK